MATILIADDDVQIQRLLTKILEAAGHHTWVASDGEACLRLYKEKRPDLLIIDMVMPNKEGIETIIELKQLDTDLKIIAISGGGRLTPDSYLPMAKKFGAVAALEKPIDRDEILAEVDRALG